MAAFDHIFANGWYFDGLGNKPYIADIAVKNGKIESVSPESIDKLLANNWHDVRGHWVTPGFIDSHTHYDAELLVAPSLSESVRHGVTTVLVGSCSLSMICSEYEDASDIFTRVETVPREKVLPILREQKSWRTPKQWKQEISQRPLGPNVISFLGHSDLRTAVMGLQRATDKNELPTELELQKMESLLEEALQEGFLGLSTMCLKWDKVDGNKAWSKSLPSTYAKWSEIKRLNNLLRKYDRVHQGAPNAAKPLQITQYLTESFKSLSKPLKTTLISRMDLKGSAYLNMLTKLAARICNFLGGDFRWQVLPTPFTVYADGIDVVFFEEFGAGEMALDLKERVERNKLLQDTDYRRKFRKFYGEKLSPRVWQRDFSDALIIDCPDPSLIGKNFAEIAEKKRIHVVDLFLDLVVEYGTKLRWVTTVANHRPNVLHKLVADKHSLITFSDAGAHIRNMAFYNLPLRMLKLAHINKVMSPEKAIYRLTGEQSDWLNVPIGTIRPGDRADLVVLNPEHLKQDLEQVSWDNMQGFDIQRLVNRNPNIVKHVMINGKLALYDGEFKPNFGKQTGYGQFIAAQTQE
jgi:N-acyl-D-aspartate/D-glutamate deacylase